MAKESALCQLMGVRMNGIMNDITNSDGEYQEIIRKSDEYSGKLERMELPEWRSVTGPASRTAPSSLITTGISP